MNSGTCAYDKRGVTVSGDCRIGTTRGRFDAFRLTKTVEDPVLVDQEGLRGWGSDRKREPGLERPKGIAENETGRGDVSSSFPARQSECRRSSPGTSHAPHRARNPGGKSEIRSRQRSVTTHPGATFRADSGARFAGMLRRSTSADDIGRLDGLVRSLKSSAIAFRSGNYKPRRGVGRLDDAMTQTG